MLSFLSPFRSRKQPTPEPEQIDEADEQEAGDERAFELHGQHVEDASDSSMIQEEDVSSPTTISQSTGAHTFPSRLAQRSATPLAHAAEPISVSQSLTNDVFILDAQPQPARLGCSASFPGPI